MRNYRRSPRCSNCWEIGHTSNHCPRIKEAAAKGDAWAIRKVEQQKASVKNRECSYCREKGHNKRGCKSRKADRIIFDKICSRFQADRVKQLKEKGVTVGSLVRYKSSYGERKPTIAVITKITTENRVALWSWIEDKYSGIEAEEVSAKNIDTKKTFLLNLNRLQVTAWVIGVTAPSLTLVLTRLLIAPTLKQLLWCRHENGSRRLG
jgi:hypothetical protein